MKLMKSTGSIILVAVAACLLVFILMAHGDDLVSGAAIADKPLQDVKMLDSINSSKGSKPGGFDGVLYTTACMEMGGYAVTKIAAVPKGKDLYASVLFNTSPKDTKYKAVWTRDGKTVKEETKSISVTTNVEAVPYMLEDTQVLPGEYVFSVCYRDKPIYTQTFTVVKDE